MYIIVLISEGDGHSEGDRLLGRHMLLCQHFTVLSISVVLVVRAETRWLSVDWPSRWDILFNCSCCPLQITFDKCFTPFCFLK